MLPWICPYGYEHNEILSCCACVAITANLTARESSMRHAGAAPEEVAETNWPHENVTAEEHVAQPAVEQQAEYEVEGIGGDMNADLGELDETIVDEMEIDNEEYRTFVVG